MDVERIIDDIEQLQEMFEAPDVRPLSPSDGRVVLGFGYRYTVNEKTTAVHAVLKPLLVTHTTCCPAHHGRQGFWVITEADRSSASATCVAFFAHGSKRHPQERRSAPVNFRVPGW